jgi:hypothetical protein
MNAITGAVSYNTKKVDKPYRKKSLSGCSIKWRKKSDGKQR